MSAIKLTAKRQATLPRALCEDIGVEAGYMLNVERAVVNGEQVWLLKPVGHAEMSFFGSLKRFARGKPHDMNSVRASIARGRRRGRN